MTYTVAPEVPLKLMSRLVGATTPVMEDVMPSAVFRLDNDDLVAMAYTVKVVDGNNMSCYIRAWLVDDQGDAQMSEISGKLIGTEFKHTAPAEQVIALGAATLATQLRDLVLGRVDAPAEYPGGAENDPLIPWSKDVRDSVNIRYAIAIARALGATIDLTA